MGELLFVQSNFENLQPIKVRGLDFNLDYVLRGTPVGNFTLNVNASKLIGYVVDAPAQVQQVIDAIGAGTINVGVPVTGGGDVIGRDGQPRWRLSATATWSLGPVTVGAYTQFIDDVYENAVRDASNTPWGVKGQTTVNLYVQYTFSKPGPLDKTSIQIGARNLFDKAPPFSSAGYLSSLYAPTARYWYTSIKKAF